MHSLPLAFSRGGGGGHRAASPSTPRGRTCGARAPPWALCTPLFGLLVCGGDLRAYKQYFSLKY